jgi:hypothetical protein
MTTYQVEFEISVPDEVQERDLEAFMRFELGESCSWTPAPESPLRKLGLESMKTRYVWVRRRAG